MIHSALRSLRPGFRRAFLIGLTASVALLASCRREAGPTPTVTDHPPAVELDDAKLKLTKAESNAAAKDDELVKGKAELEATRIQLAEKVVIATEQAALTNAARSELDALKKRDAFVFAEISAIQQKGQTVNALSRYQQFLKDYPTSPLAIHATNAVTELKTNNERENPPKPDLRDPKVRQREFVQQFEEGFLSLQELAPVLKKRSVSQVLALLGPPNRIFGDGTEIGYVDKAIDPVTSKRGMFIIAFESGQVANLRVEYAGRRMVP